MDVGAATHASTGAAAATTTTRRRGRTSLNPMTHEPVPPSCLPNLRKYRYNSVDKSLMSRYVLYGYWNFIVGLMPMTVAPNALTLVGFVIGLSASAVLLACYCLSHGMAGAAAAAAVAVAGGVGNTSNSSVAANATATAATTAVAVATATYPAWTWYYAALSLFAYQTLDAIDGKQARRTGTGSPLGELFDHGCDAFLTPFVQLNACLCLRAPPWMTFVFLMQSALALFCAIWEQYTVGTMQLGYLSGPTDGIVLLCVMFIVRGYFGAQVWDTTVVGPYTWTLSPSTLLSTSLSSLLRPVLPYEPIVLHAGSLRSIVFVAFTLAWVATVTPNIAHALAWRPRGGGRSCLTAYTSGVPMLLLACVHTALYMTYTRAQQRFPLVFELSFALVVTYTVSRLTIARLCTMPSYSYASNWLYMALLALSSTALLTHALGYNDRLKGGQARAETLLGYALTVLVFVDVAVYAHMIVSTFTQFARFLGIHILSIAPPSGSGSSSSSIIAAAAAAGKRD